MDITLFEPIALYSGIRTDRHIMAGTVTVDGIPAQRIVVAFNRFDLAFVAATFSSPIDGKWRLSGLPQYPESSLLVIAMDTAGNYNAEVADYISQVAS